MVLLYIKLVEEKELELRFGKGYIEYKKRTPILIPWLGCCDSHVGSASRGMPRLSGYYLVDPRK